MISLLGGRGESQPGSCFLFLENCEKRIEWGGLGSLAQVMWQPCCEGTWDTAPTWELGQPGLSRQRPGILAQSMWVDIEYTWGGGHGCLNSTEAEDMSGKKHDLVWFGGASEQRPGLGSRERVSRTQRGKNQNGKGAKRQNRGWGTGLNKSLLSRRDTSHGEVSSSHPPNMGSRNTSNPSLPDWSKVVFLWFNLYFLIVFVET